MFKRMIFAEFLATVSVLPAFSAGFDSNATGDMPNACVVDYLGVTGGGTRLKAIWNPRVYSFDLDDKFYTSSTDENGTEPTASASYESLYSRYRDGIYGNLDGANQGDEEYRIEWLNVPEKTGYYFMGYFTSKYSGGDQVIGADGHILSALQSIVPEDDSETTRLYAQWIARTYTCAAGQYLSAQGCEECPDGSWCPGVAGVVYDGADHAIYSCKTKGEYYLHSDNGRDEEGDCYQEVSVSCAVKNPYDPHGVAKYKSESGYAACKQYYGSESDKCIMADETACDVQGLTCNTGYVLDQNESRCVPGKVKCLPGTYLPAGAYECVSCTEDHYCPGDQPAFTVPQNNDMGIVSCVDAQTGGTKSPAGAQKIEDCGIVVRVDDVKLYLHSDKATSPSFAIAVDGKPWYADMTPVTTCEKTISPDTSKTWHVVREGVEYTVHGRYVECKNQE